MSSRAIQGIFFGGLTLLLVLIMTAALPHIMPQTWATRISYNSEGYLFAVVLGAWLLYGMPRLSDEQRMPWALALGAVWALVGVGLLMSDLPSRIRTLNETALALAVLLPYVTLRRPLPRSAVLLVPAVVVALVIWAVGWSPTSWVIDQAESLGLVVLTVLTFDLVDRELLQPERRTSVRTRWLWYGFMVLEPVVVSGLGTEIRGEENWVGLALEFLGRIHESFVGVLLVAAILIVVRRAAARAPSLAGLSAPAGRS